MPPFMSSISSTSNSISFNGLQSLLDHKTTTNIGHGNGSTFCSMSLEMCTETLGCETGAIYSMSDYNRDVLHSPMVQLEKQKKKQEKRSKRMEFPPPLSTMRVKMVSKRVEGRLVMFSMGSTSMEAEMGDGRLCLKLHYNNNDNRSSSSSYDDGNNERSVTSMFSEVENWNSRKITKEGEEREEGSVCSSKLHYNNNDINNNNNSIESKREEEEEMSVGSIFSEESEREEEVSSSRKVEEEDEEEEDLEGMERYGYGVYRWGCKDKEVSDHLRGKASASRRMVAWDSEVLLIVTS